MQFRKVTACGTWNFGVVVIYMDVAAVQRQVWFGESSPWHGLYKGPGPMRLDIGGRQKGEEISLYSAISSLANKAYMGVCLSINWID